MSCFKKSRNSRSMRGGTGVVALGALAALMGGPTTASALTRPPQGTTGLHYYGYFDDASQDDAVATANHANVVFYADVNDTDPPGQYTAAELKKLTGSPTTSGMGAMLGVENIFFTQDIHFNFVPRNSADWQARWSAYKTQIAPYLANVVAFYVFDEPNPADGTLMSFLDLIATQIKTDYPNIHRSIFFAARDMDLAPVNWTIPLAVDWVGYDCYTGPFEQCFDKVAHGTNTSYNWRSVPYYYALLRQAIARTNAGLAPGAPPYHPGLVLLPQAYIDTEPPTAQAQERMLSRVEREVVLAESDPDFVMIMPFRWQLLSPLATALSYYAHLGQHVVSGTSRFAYPTSVSASASVPGAEASNAFDYSASTAWSAGTPPIASIQASFADPIVATKVGALVAQSPTGYTEHALKYANFQPNTGTLTWFTGTTSDSQLLTWTGSQTLNYLNLLTQTSPSWVSWKDLAIYASGSTRLYPTAISATSGGDSLLSLVDGDNSTSWNSGGYQPAYVVLDLRAPQTISHIQLVVNQNPTGTTTHTVYGGPARTGLTQLKPPITGNTSDGQVIDLFGSWTNIRYLRIDTTQSPSWVAWREINVFR